MQKEAHIQELALLVHLAAHLESFLEMRIICCIFLIRIHPQSHPYLVVINFLLSAEERPICWLIDY